MARPIRLAVIVRSGCVFHTSSDPCPSSETTPDQFHVGQRVSSSVPGSTTPSPLYSGQSFSIIFVPSLVSPLCDKPAALVFRYLELLDRLLDRALLIRGVMDDADELGWCPADMVDGQGVDGLLLDRALRHCEGTIARTCGRIGAPSPR